MRLTSNENEYNADLVRRVLRLNKFNHKVYNPSLLNKQWRKHFHEIINTNRTE